MGFWSNSNRFGCFKIGFYALKYFKMLWVERLPRYFLTKGCTKIFFLSELLYFKPVALCGIQSESVCSVSCGIHSRVWLQSQQLLRGRPLVSHWTQEECHWRHRRCCQQGQRTPALEFSSEWLDSRLKKWGVGVERLPHMLWSFPPWLIFFLSLIFHLCIFSFFVGLVCHQAVFLPWSLNYDRQSCSWPECVSERLSKCSEYIPL